MDTTITGIQQFILAGKSTFTIKNDRTSGRFTYKVDRVENNDGTPKDLWFVSALTGSDNESSYSYMGLINKNGFRLTKKSKFTPETTSVKGFTWLWNMVTVKKELPENVKFYHEGRCAKCGRKLTTPESIEAGYGPICIDKMGI